VLESRSSHGYYVHVLCVCVCVCFVLSSASTGLRIGRSPMQAVLPKCLKGFTIANLIVNQKMAGGLIRVKTLYVPTRTLVTRSKNEWSCNSIPQYTSMAWCSVKAEGRLYLSPLPYPKRLVYLISCPCA
jgi:hypothetical protein